MPNAIDILVEDHRKAEQLFERIEGTEDAEERGRLFRELANALRVHVTVEKEVFYPRIQPRLQDVVDDEMWESQREEETEGSAMMEELEGMSPGDEAWMEKLGEFKDTALGHAREEEDELFPKVKEKLSRADLDNLGRDMTKRITELQRELGAAAR